MSSEAPELDSMRILKSFKARVWDPIWMIANEEPETKGRMKAEQLHP
jgi:hypothetical protein